MFLQRKGTIMAKG